MRISLIAALDRNRVIGANGDLPWHLPDDLKRFKALTMGKPLLMGRKTAQSLGRALPGRLNLVLTRTGEAPLPGMQAVASAGEALAIAQAQAAEELCVIGGGEVFTLLLPMATHMHLTHVLAAVESGDAWFPDFEEDEWERIATQPHAADARHAHAFTFADYVRRFRSGGSAP